LPYGLRTAATVHRVVPVELEGSETLSKYDDALARFEAGQWKESTKILESLGDEPCSKFLLGHIQAHSELQPPSDFDGVVQLTSK